jgi:U6 snRNA-associated Sm-like protein LSm7
MSDRPFHRGGRGGGDRGGGGGGYRGGRGGGRGGGPRAEAGAGGAQTERPKKENILDLAKYLDKAIIVKFNGGREGKYEQPRQDQNKQTNAETNKTVRGTLKGYDALMNLVLDEVEESLRGKLLLSPCQVVVLLPSPSSSKFGHIINQKEN